MTGILVEKAPPKLLITIDRPKANALDAEASRGLGEVFTEFRDDTAYRVAILTGAGDRFFCAGWDLKAAAEGERFDEDFGAGGFGGFQSLPDLNKPVICAVNGMAVGGGCEMLLAADLIVAADHSELFMPEVFVGMIPDTGSVRLPRMIPPAIAKELLLTGRRLSAAEALELGLVNLVVPGDRLMDAAHEMAEKIIEAAPLAVATVLDLIRRTQALDVEQSFALMPSVESYQKLVDSEDAVEGARAFVEKRAPVWKGR